MDGRHYGGGVGSALSVSNVNALDVLQLFAEFRFGTNGNDLPRHQLRLGRQTIDLGSRRLVARNNFRNTINAFTGASWRWVASDTRSSAHVFWTTPVRRRPDDLASTIDNVIELDDQDLDVQFFGGFYERKLRIGALQVEGYVYGLEEDAPGTRHRSLITPGVRLRRPAATGELDIEIETAYQFGNSRLDATGPSLDHQAWFQHLSVGYTFRAPWTPRVRFAFDFASGDRDPDDTDNQRFDTLFGARRFEYGPTGIYGAIARSNIASPELRLELKPGSDLQWLVATRALRLASRRDTWTAASITDASGASGRHLGQQVETRIRWNLRQSTVRLEAGIAYLFNGRFQEEAVGGQGTDTAYGYFQTSWTF